MKRLLCWFDVHVPIRDEVHWDGASYTGECDRCGTTIRRMRRRRWKRDKPHQPE